MHLPSCKVSFLRHHCEGDSYGPILKMGKKVWGHEMHIKTTTCVQFGLAAAVLSGQPQCLISGLGSCPLLLVRDVDFTASSLHSCMLIMVTLFFTHHPAILRAENANEAPPKAKVGVSAFRIVFHSPCPSWFPLPRFLSTLAYHSHHHHHHQSPALWQFE